MYTISVRFTIYIYTLTVSCRQASSCFEMIPALVRCFGHMFHLSAHPGGVWLGHIVAYTRQKGGPLPTQWPPSPATATFSSLQLSCRTGVWTQVLSSQWIQKPIAITIRPQGTHMTKWQMNQCLPMALTYCWKWNSEITWPRSQVFSEFDLQQTLQIW